MPAVILKFPLLTGKVEAWRRFCQELAGSRASLHAASRRRLGIASERMVLIETPFGSMAVTTLEARNIDCALAQFITSDLPFDRWYRERLAELHGVSLTRHEHFDLLSAPANHPQELLFQWDLPASSSN